MATFSTAFGSLPGTADALGTNNNTKGGPGQAQAKSMTGLPAGQQPGQGQQSQQQGAQAKPLTFAELQRQGQARPAPPPAPAAPVVSNGSAESLRSALLQQINTMLAGTPDPSFAAQGAVKRADLAAEFGASKQALDEEMARRGLSASTIGAGRYGDLEGQNARALAALEADILRMQEEAKARDRQAGFQGLTSLAQMTGDIEMRALQLQQEAALQGRSLDLTAARDKAQQELGYAELAYKRDALTAEREMESARLEETRALRLQNLGISQQQLDLEARKLQQEAALRGRELDLMEARDLAEIEYRAKQLMLDDRRLTSEEAREKARLEFERERERERQALERERNAQDNTNQQLDRELRERLGMDQLKVDQLRATQEGKAFLLQLAQFIGRENMSNEMWAMLTGQGSPPSSQTQGGNPPGGPGNNGGPGGPPGTNNTDI